MSAVAALFDQLERDGSAVAPPGVYMEDVQAEMSRRGCGGVSAYGGGYDCVAPHVEVWGPGGKRLGTITWKRT